MRLIEMTENDYVSVVEIAKEIFNFDYLLTRKNDDFNLALSRFVTSTIAKEITHGAFIETSSGDRVAMIAYAIPGNSPLFSSLETDFETNINVFKKYIRDFKITNNEKLIINKEIDVANSFNTLFYQYETLLQNKAEVKLLYVHPNYRGKFLSKTLFSKFYDDLLKSVYDSFYLFTTTEHNFRFYERLKMKGLDLVIYDKYNAPEFLKYKFRLPYKAIVYLGNRNEVIF